MKRSTLRPSPMPARKTALRARQSLRRRTAIKPVNRARKEKLAAIQYGRKAEWIRTLPCEACGASPTVAHHVRTKGAGGSSDDLAALCVECHDLVHALGRSSFRRVSGVNLVAAANRLHGEWLLRLVSDQAEGAEARPLVVHEGVAEDRAVSLQIREDPARRLADMFHTPSSR